MRLSASEGKYVVATVSEEHYGLPISSVREIIASVPITRVPGAPPGVEGVIKLRDSVLPVVDLRKCLGADASGSAPRIAVVDLDDLRVGLAVDAVTDVLSISRDQIEPPPQLIGSSARMVSGIVRKDDSLILLLDLNRAPFLDRSALGDAAGAEVSP